MLTIYGVSIVLCFIKTFIFCKIKYPPSSALQLYRRLRTLHKSRGSALAQFLSNAPYKIDVRGEPSAFARNVFHVYDSVSQCLNVY